eukprot:COSAG06_NODE_4008_length_4666_cov_3.913072_3_plen_45_part_00
MALFENKNNEEGAFFAPRYARAGRRGRPVALAAAARRRRGAGQN